MPPSDEIIIAGAGIGGLAAALSLHAAGFAVQVFESVPEIKPLGVGFNMLPHAVRELDELGLREPIEHSGVACRELAYFTKRGERIWASRGGLPPGTAGRRFPSTAEHFISCCWRLSNNVSAAAACIRAANWLDSTPNPAVASGRDLLTAPPAGGASRRTGACWSRATESIPPRGGYCIPTRGRRAGTER